MAYFTSCSASILMVNPEVTQGIIKNGYVSNKNKCCNFFKKITF